MAELTSHFDGIIARDRSSFRIYLSLFAGLLVVGIAVLAAGFLVPLGAADATGTQALLVKLGGLLIGTFSTIPLKEGVERRDRLGYVELIRDRWLELSSRQKPPQAQLTRIENIVWTLYEKRSAG